MTLYQLIFYVFLMIFCPSIELYGGLLKVEGFANRCIDWLLKR